MAPALGGTFGSIINFESGPSRPSSSSSPSIQPIPSAPQKAVPKHYHSNPHTPIELDNIKWDRVKNGHSQSGTATPVSGPNSGWQTPLRGNDLEMSRPQSPDEEPSGGDALQSFSNPPMNRYRMTSTCLMNFGNGLSDAAAGPLIPHMLVYYGTQQRIVSLIFVTQAIGYISAAFFVDALRARFGRAKALIFAQSLMCIGYIINVTAPPFPLVVVAFLFVGFGMAINLSLSNVFAANLQNGTTMLGAMHGSYGFGGIIAPLAATAIVSHGARWSWYYFIPLAITLVNIVLAGWSFWHYETESGAPLLTEMERTASGGQVEAARPNIKSQILEMLRAARLRAVLIGAIFIFAYQGAEVSISGWVVYFLQEVRGGGSSVGYVTAGFWAGITLGRLFLSPIGHKIGEKKFVYIVVILSAVFEGLVWGIPNVIGDAVAVAIVGLLLGPVYPCATYIFSRIIPRKDQVSGLSVVSALGSSGGALAPFTTGVLAQAVGNFVLHPIAIALFAAMMVCWLCLPEERKRTE